MMYAIADIESGEIKFCSQILHEAAMAYVPGTAHGKGVTKIEAEACAKNNAYSIKRALIKHRPTIVRV